VKRLRISVLMISVLALLTFAYLGGDVAGADSISGKWVSPAQSAAKKNPIAPTQDSIACRVLAKQQTEMKSNNLEYSL
jgi:hypothetical protein